MNNFDYTDINAANAEIADLRTLLDEANQRIKELAGGGEAAYDRLSEIAEINGMGILDWRDGDWTFDKLKAAFDASTPGEWVGTSSRTHIGYGWVKAPDGGVCTFGQPIEILKSHYRRQPDDAEFIALAHNLMPTLLEAVDLVRVVVYGNTELDELEEKANKIMYQLAEAQVARDLDCSVIAGNNQLIESLQAENEKLNSALNADWGDGVMQENLVAKKQLEESTRKLATVELDNKRLREALEYLVENVEEPPDRNCYCHISPPCSDCVDYSGIREALNDAHQALKSTKRIKGE